MNAAEHYRRLTPAARQALEEVVQDYQNKIIATAAMYASGSTGAPSDISVRDIFDSVSRHRMDTTSPRRKTEGYVRLYAAIVGASGAVAGLVFVVGGFSFVPDFTKWLPLLLSVAATSLAVLALTLTYLRARVSAMRREYYRARRSRPESVSRFLTAWIDLELQMRSLSSRLYGESVSAQPLSLLMGRLAGHLDLTSSEVTQLRRLLAVRNRIVHSGDLFSASELEAHTRALDALTRHLRIPASQAELFSDYSSEAS